MFNDVLSHASDWLGARRSGFLLDKWAPSSAFRRRQEKQTVAKIMSGRPPECRNVPVETREHHPDSVVIGVLRFS